MARETFMQDVKWLETLKLRVGYGETSNQSVNPYSTMGTLSTRPYNFGESYAVGTYVSSLPNAALGWEYSKTWNFGVDFTLLKGRLSGTLEYYVQNTEDLLMGVNLPSTTGVNSYMAIAPQIDYTFNRNFGVEIEAYNCTRERLARELKSLQALKDNYPKYLLTFDEVNATADYGGIKKRNVLRWLLGEE